LLALDQMLVEGFVPTELRKIAVSVGVKIDTAWQGLKIIQEILRAKDSLTADQVVEPLRELHRLRSKVPGHHTGERVKLEAAALREFGSLPAHFRALCTRCDEAFELIVAALTAAK
jgi:hypothetical protein